MKQRMAWFVLTSACLTGSAFAQFGQPVPRPENEVVQKYAVNGLTSVFQDFYSLRSDCTPMDWTSVLFQIEPKNGEAKVEDRKAPVNANTPNTPFRQCHGRLVDSKALTFTPKPGYTGNDQIAVEVIDSSGARQLYTFNIVVR